MKTNGVLGCVNKSIVDRLREVGFFSPFIWHSFSSATASSFGLKALINLCKSTRKLPRWLRVLGHRTCEERLSEMSLFSGKVAFGGKMEWNQQPFGI